MKKKPILEREENMWINAFKPMSSTNRENRENKGADSFKHWTNIKLKVILLENNERGNYKIKSDGTWIVNIEI